MCNKEIKFGLFLEKAIKEGATYIATGHYVRRKEIQDLTSNTTYQLLKGVDQNKDQSYFLYNITQEQLSHSLFPIGHLTKPEVRKLAFKMKLPNAARPDSQGICFIGEIDVQEFLRSNITSKTGNIVNIDTNEVVGKHDGVWYYTLGQRDGLGIGGQKIPYFVVGKDVDNNVVYVGHGHEHKKLLSKVVSLENLYFIDPLFEKEKDDVVLSGVARYRQKPQDGLLNISSKTFTFDEPQRAITSGQSLVLYDGEVCVGGGVIR
jgi:tRNA-specific 2-thiouridylase